MESCRAISCYFQILSKSEESYSTCPLKVVILSRVKIQPCPVLGYWSSVEPGQLVLQFETNYMVLEVKMADVIKSSSSYDI